MKRMALVIGGVLIVGVVAFVWRRAPASTLSGGEAVALRDTNALTIAAVGDVLGGERLSAWRLPPDLHAILNGSSLTIANLDQPIGTSPGAAPGRPVWPVAPPQLAGALRAFGVSVVTLAGEHLGDNPAQSVDTLSEVGLRTAGAGVDLDAARAAATLGSAPRRVAVLNVATTVLPGGRATRRRGDVLGRPGAYSVRYVARVVADPQTFAALSEMAKAIALADDGTSTTADRVTLSGTEITRGPHTSVELVADPQDMAALIDDVKTARQSADVVIVSVHTHEPGNRSETPAAFVRELAHQAIDAGASMVVGHGTRQLRGIETYRSGVIFYGLGSFAFETSAIPEGAGTIFDSDVSAYDLALGAVQRPERQAMPRFDEPEWWESIVATATFNGTQLASVVLTPIDLGVDDRAGERGLPRLASAERSARVLSRLQRVSAAFDTTITVNDGRGHVVPRVASGVAP